MRRRATLIGVAGVVALSLSGARGADPRTPAAPERLPAPYLGTAVIGSGGLNAAVDAYGQIVDLRHRPAGPEVVSASYGRQLYGTIEPGTGLGLRAGTGGRLRPLWEGTGQRQRYLPGTNVLVTSARVGDARVSVTDAIHPRRSLLVRRAWARVARGSAVEPTRARLVLASESPSAAAGVRCESSHRRIPGLVERTWVCAVGGATAAEPSLETGARAAEVIDAAAQSDRRWLARARPLGPQAPRWARRLHRRSLLVLRALTDRHSGAQVAGARDFWAYVWPRDAAAGAIALARSGYRAESQRIAAFLGRLDLDDAARFRGDGSGVNDARGPAGDATGWVRAAAGASGAIGLERWRGRQDYAESDEGDLLANAIASGVGADEVVARFGGPNGTLVRESGGGELDPAAAWAVVPFRSPALAGPARRTLLELVGKASRHGLEPAGDPPGAGFWTAPTAWSAWALARLGERAAADRLLAALRRSAAGPGTLPERVDGRGIALSTTPLAWSHAFAILALRARYRN